MTAYPKSVQARRKGGVKPPARKSVGGSTLKSQRKPLRRRSFTNSRAIAKRTEYPLLRAAFLEVNEACELRVAGVCRGHSTTVQHMVQTSLDPSIENLLDVHFWKASCWQCNDWCATRPKEAEALGLEIRPQVRDAIRASLGITQEAA